jgi:hypothetical protein
LLFVIVSVWPPRPTTAKRDKPTSTKSDIKVETATANGLVATSRVTPRGRVSIFLPDDMAAGDIISGTVTAEAAGTTSQERQKNLEELTSEITNDLMKIAAQGVESTKFGPEGNSSTTFKLHVSDASRELTWGTNRTFSVPILPPSAVLPSTTSGFVLPNLGQTGRPIQIGGNFDGDLSNTSCTVGGRSAQVLAESPRKAVFESPQNIVGQTQITVREAGEESQGFFRNIDVRLTAPKTALTKGETTTVTIEVSGLENLEQNVPMDLNCSGVADMAGGNQQNLQIKPGDVKANGKVTQTRKITGKQAGGFAVNANVKANNQPCRLTGQIVHVEGEPYGGNQSVWKVKIKLQDGTETEIVIQSDQKPDLKFCNWIQINSCKDGVVPPEDRHGYDKVPQPPDPKSASATPAPSPTLKPSPPTDLPKSPSSGCTPPAEKLIKRDTSEPIHIVDGNSEFKLEISIVRDTKGRQEAQDLASWFRGISNLGGLIAGKLPKGAPDIGMGANVASLIFAELDAGADILDAAAKARLTSMDPTKFKINFEVKTTKITPYCDTWEVCRNGVWVIEKRYGQDESKSAVTITRTIDSSMGDWGLVSSGPKGRFDPQKADDYARSLVKGVFAGLSANKNTLATVQSGCE